jgi:hypothetical protein
MASYDMVHRYVRNNDHKLTIIWVILYGQKFMLCIISLGSNGYFMINTSCLNVGHGYRRY